MLFHCNFSFFLVFLRSVHSLALRLPETGRQFVSFSTIESQYCHFNHFRGHTTTIFCEISKSDDIVGDNILYHDTENSKKITSNIDTNRNENDSKYRNPLIISSPLTLLGADSFGDILGGDGLETNIASSSSSGSALSVHDFSAMERVVLTANGNLQRIMSSYYGAKVSVRVIKCDKISPTIFDRQVELYVNDRKFCTAIGKINVKSDECLDAIASKQVGVGQLFRFIRALPCFHLIDADRLYVASVISDNSAAVAPLQCLRRRYQLSCPQVSCEFVETFEPNFLDLDFLLK